GTIVMRNKEYLAAVRPVDGYLAMSTMRFADELVAADELVDVVGDESEPTEKELRMAEQIIDSLTTEWNPEQYRDTYHDELRSMMEQRGRGGRVTVDAGPAAPSNVTDLMAALEASVKSAKEGKATSKSEDKPAARRRKTA